MFSLEETLLLLKQRKQRQFVLHSFAKLKQNHPTQAVSLNTTPGNNRLMHEEMQKIGAILNCTILWHLSYILRESNKDIRFKYF